MNRGGVERSIRRLGFARKPPLSQGRQTSPREGAAAWADDDWLLPERGWGRVGVGRNRRGRSNRSVVFGRHGKGNCLDNGPMESFFGYLKTELVHRTRFLPGARPGLRYSSTSRSSITNDGATRALTNLQLLCSGCNRSKGGRTMAEWRAAT